MGKEQPKKAGFLEFMTTLPGLLTAVATIMTAIAGLYLAFKPDSKPNQNATSLATPTAVSDSPFEIIKGKGQTTITNRLGVQLLDVETLKGKSRGNESPSHDEFNKKLDDREHVFEEVLTRAGVGGVTAQAVLNMNQQEWEKFLDSLDSAQKDKVKETPFAKFNVYIDGVKDRTHDHKFYFQGENIPLKIGDQNLRLEITNISNTKNYLEPESVKVRLK